MTGEWTKLGFEVIHFNKNKLTIFQNPSISLGQKTLGPTEAPLRPLSRPGPHIGNHCANQLYKNEGN